MPHVTLSWYDNGLGRAAFWREAHRLMKSRVNFVVLTSDRASRRECYKSLHRYIREHDLPCIIKSVEGGVVAAFF